MSRLSKTVVPFYWSTVTVNFTQGTAASVNLAVYVNNPKALPLTYSVIGSLPTGVTLTGSTVSYNGTAPAVVTSVQFRAVSGVWTVDSAVTLTRITAPATTNQAPVITVANPLTVTLANNYSATTVPLTASDIDGPVALTFGRTGSASDTAAGTVTVTSASGVGSLSIPAGLAAGTHTVEYYVSDGYGELSLAQQDWLARSTAAGVIWVNDFTNANELTRFLDNAYDATKGTIPTIVNDPEIGPCLQCLAIGSLLTQPFANGATSLSVTDASGWPQSNFYLILARPSNPNVAPEMVHVASRSGNVLTVDQRGVNYAGGYVTTSGGASWIATDTAGHQSGSWIRPFSAFATPGNGRSANDRADAGGAYATTVRTWARASEGGDSSYGGGYYGHPTYQAARPTFRNVTNCWDGDEFWLSFKVKIDGNFWNYHVPTNFGYADGTDVWGRKLMFIQTVLSVYHQVVPYLDNAGKYIADRSYFRLTTDKATRNFTQTYGDSGFPEAGSQWGATCIPGSSGAGVSGNCFEYPADTWLTMSYHIKPGLTNTAGTDIEVKAWWAGQPGWVTLYSSTGQVLKYSDSNDNQTTSATEVQPGFNGVNLGLYMNMSQAGNIPPVHDMYQRFGQVIFSRQPIAAPTV